jgi:hypothetical protein
MIAPLRACVVVSALAACSARGSSDPGIAPDAEGGTFGEAGTQGAEAGASSQPDAAQGVEGGRPDASSTVDAGPSEITCNDQGLTCSVPAQVCCETFTPFSRKYACVAPQECTGASSTPIPCDDARDCAALGAPGAVCCAAVDTGGAMMSVTCALPENCTPSGHRILCDPHDFSSCPTGKTCKPNTTILPDVDVCE